MIDRRLIGNFVQEQVAWILSHTPIRKQTMIFSVRGSPPPHAMTQATFTDAALKLIAKHMRNPQACLDHLCVGSRVRAVRDVVGG